MLTSSSNALLFSVLCALSLARSGSAMSLPERLDARDVSCTTRTGYIGFPNPANTSLPLYLNAEGLGTLSPFPFTLHDTLEAAGVFQFADCGTNTLSIQFLNDTQKTTEVGIWTATLPQLAHNGLKTGYNLTAHDIGLLSRLDGASGQPKNAQGQAAIWSIDSTHRQLAANWVQPDNSLVPVNFAVLKELPVSVNVLTLDSAVTHDQIIIGQSLSFSPSNVPLLGRCGPLDGICSSGLQCIKLLTGGDSLSEIEDFLVQYFPEQGIPVTDVADVNAYLVANGWELPSIATTSSACLNQDLYNSTLANGYQA